ncbi:small-conductance mechanosensitive channel [archaeon BMS3Abin16]|nr:small-conductance mechanosensitive channel [archaeon BMS3Abin16]GBE56483.1 small-conductance mechanosensitive channel [archaeon BMS3Bbin16]HDY74710.1 mechanosensitive ion channel family protein [Euryarchaeota archaeon]
MLISLSAEEAIKALGIILLSVVASRIFIYFITNHASRLAQRTNTDFDDALIDASKTPLYYLIILIGTDYALHQITTLPSLTTGLESAIFVFEILLLAIFINRILGVTVEWYSKNIAVKTETKFDDEFLPLFKRTSAIFIYGAATVIVLDYFSYDITAIVAGLGIAGIAVALAAQDTLSNMISGFVIMADRPFRVKDIIELPSGEYGEVSEIGLRSTKILTLDALMIVIPNAKIGDSQIVNYSYPDRRMRLKIPVGVAYDSDIDFVTEILISIAKRQPHVLESPVPRVTLESFGDSSINLLLYVWIDSHKDKVQVINKINRDIDKMFKKEGVEIPFPIRTIYSRNGKSKDGGE